MDDKPFWEFNITDLNEQATFELKKYHKSHFSVENILSSATELKYAKEIKRIMLEEMANPTDPFVKHFGKQIVSGPMTAKVLEQFTGLVKKSLNGLISEMISDRLKSALASEEDRSFVQTRVAEDTTVHPVTTEAVSKVTTTEAEKEAFYIIRSILRAKLDANRVCHRDTQSYFGVLLDDNNRRPICRLNLEGAKKTITLFDEAKKESRHELQNLDDIYAHSDQLINTALSYDIKTISVN
ncbi:hypothetical protein [Nibribacter ruber]|uniref:hypothetical protein n=1 Tax=Nibribacter ruber TaxID=2698458 RepID=UPI001E3A1D1B|nr:hypothetical protein [Nibribacter ruber]